MTSRRIEMAVTMMAVIGQCHSGLEDRSRCEGEGGGGEQQQQEEEEMFRQLGHRRRQSALLGLRCLADDEGLVCLLWQVRREVLLPFQSGGQPGPVVLDSV